jgi:hypothetical protein
MNALLETLVDRLILHGDKVVPVIDTKWKRIPPGIDDPGRGVARGISIRC